MDHTTAILICIVAGAVLIIAACIRFAIKPSRRRWVDTEEFDRWQAAVNARCDDRILKEYMEFLKDYGGGYIKRKNGIITYQDFLGKEKGALKGIFFNVIVPSSRISVRNKEEFRRYLISIGVTGISERPKYELRDGALKNYEKDEDDFHRKQAGNMGEKKVRDCLNNLSHSKYHVVNGVVMRYKGVKREFDHIVIGRNGLFIIETKAFGMSDTDEARDEAELIIDRDDNWQLTKNGRTKELKSPTGQIHEQKKFMENIISGSSVSNIINVRPVLVLSNEKLTYKKKFAPDYKILNLSELQEYIEENKDHISYNEVADILTLINKYRIN